MATEVIKMPTNANKTRDSPFALLDMDRQVLEDVRNVTMRIRRARTELGREDGTPTEVGDCQSGTNDDPWHW